MASRPENCNNARRRIKVQEIVYFVRKRNDTCSNHKCKLHFALHITQSFTLIIPSANLLLAFDVPEHKNCATEILIHTLGHHKTTKIEQATKIQP
jgi:hypothetical protein